MINCILEFLEFDLHLIIFYILCTIGTVTAFFVKKEFYKNDPDKKKSVKNKKISSAFVSSIIPSVILVIIDETSLFVDVGLECKYGVAILVGVIGEDISLFVLSMRNMAAVIGAVFRGIDGIKELTETINNDNDEKK